MIHSNPKAPNAAAIYLHFNDENIKRYSVSKPHWLTEEPPVDEQLVKFFPKKNYNSTKLTRAPFVGQTADLYIPSALYFLNWQKPFLEKNNVDMFTFNLVYHEIKSRHGKGQKVIKTKVIDVDSLNILSSSGHRYDIVHPHGEIQVEAVSKAINLYDYIFPPFSFSSVQEVSIFKYK